MPPAVAANTTPTAAQWQEIELTFELPSAAANPYTDVDVWVEFTHSDGEVLTRPAFWDGGDVWRCRFASTQPSGIWRWQATPAPRRARCVPPSGALNAGPALAENARGLLRLAPGGRTLVHSDGTPALIVADTAWAMPWRATVEDVERYATDRQQKGFNAVLLMTVQPDMGATGPRGRNIDYGFEVGFEDLPNGHLNQLNADYFQYFDKIVSTLHRHGITPILQPVFHGFGWKGLGVAGPVVPTEEYARYCRYLVARYGARPAIYLVGADGSGTEPQVEAGGVEVQRWDAYGQPTGIHYQPHSTADAHQAAEWLDFQSCQTGHQGDHVPDRVANLWRNEPHKAVMNGEPTYEETVRPGNGAGWWQGHEAWSNLCAGGTMGVVYGAGSLWQWRVRPDEPGFHPYFLADRSRLAGGAGIRGLPLRRPGRQDPCRPPDLEPPAVLGSGPVQPWPGRPGGAVHRLRRARWPLGCPGHEGPRALPVLADRSEDRGGGHRRTFRPWRWRDRGRQHRPAGADLLRHAATHRCQQLTPAAR